MTKDSQNSTQKINEAVDAYFENNSSVDCFAAKKIMPDLVKAGVFVKDKKNGLPLRQVLRLLDEKKGLGSIPLIYAERIGVDVYWYFVREGAKFVSNHITNAPNAKQKRALDRSDNDEAYLMDLIDGLLGQTGSRRHTFDYLLGDLHQNGTTRTKLPIDIYYVDLKLALEFVEDPDKTKANKSIRDEKLTVSGMTRAEQRYKYSHRKKNILLIKEKIYLEIPLEKFELNESNQLARIKENDERVLKDLLFDFMH